VRKTRPCCICHRWFRPDGRVGARQRTCGGECRPKLRKKTQAAWRQRNPDYFRERRLSARFEAAREAEDKKPSNLGGERPRRPPPLRVNDRLGEVPWDLAQDEIGIQVTDFIATTAKVVLRAAQDEIARQVAERLKDRQRVPPLVVQDEIRAPSP
jgi:hypothetical protein